MINQTNSSWLFERIYFIQDKDHIDNLFHQIYNLIKHQPGSEVGLFLKNNLNLLPVLKDALELCNQFFLSTKRDPTLFDTSGIDNIKLEDDVPYYNVDIWDDPDFNEDYTLVLIITLPENLDYDIFDLWKRLDELIYSRIDSNLLITSIREQ